MYRDCWRPPTLTCSSSTTPERRNVSDLPAKCAASTAGECACSTMERQPNCALMFAYTSTHLPQTLHRTWRPFCIACSITCLKPLWFLLVGASEKHYVQWACSWCSDPSTACPCSLWCYSDTARQIRTSEAIHDATSCTRALYSMEATSNICCDIDGIQAMYCVPGLFVWCCSPVPPHEICR